jgi:Ca2+-binding RTX toxin-like protein
MSTLFQAYINALLADATYALGKSEQGDLTGATAQRLTDYLSDRMTPTLAKYIGDNFTVMTHIETGDFLGSGFDATVWKENATGKIFISMQGTAGAADFATDGTLALFSGAKPQIVDMVNWWLRITTPVGESARQIENAAPGIWRLGSSVPGTGELAGVSNAQINGHSLGGHLATAFARIFGGSVTIDDINTFNSPGFNTVQAESLFTTIQGLLGTGLNTYSSAQSNYYAANGTDFTTNEWWFAQRGTRVGVFQEDGLGSILGVIPDPFSNHYMYKLTDALALGSALEKLDNTFTVTKLNAIIKAGSNEMAGSYEGVLDTLLKILVAPSVAPLPVGDVSSSAASRVRYHEAIDAFLKTPAFTSLEGKLLIKASDANALRAAARNSFAALVALTDLSPVSITGKDAAADVVLNFFLQQSRAADYAAWEADKSTSSPTTFTDQWLADRAAMLGKLIEKNSSDTQGVLPGSDPARYYDVSSKTEILVGNYGNDGRARYIFGSEKNDGEELMLGQGFDDHLYGGGGIDTLKGQGGKDHLEGGIGNDFLIGGAGNDVLLGGEGFDTYTYTTGDGADIIRDSDKRGVIVWDKKNLTGGSISTGDRSWRDANGRTYVETDKGLLIDGKVLVEGWKSGDLGLQMAKTPAAQNQTEDRVVRGDPQILSTLLSNSDGLPERSKPVRWYSTPTDGRPPAPAGFSYVDYFMVDANGNPVSGGGGAYDDDLTDWNPNQGSAVWGDLSIYGGAGNDHVTAVFGLGKYYVDLGDGDDSAYLGYRNSDMPSYSQWAGFPVVSKNDTVVGGAGSDIVTGGAGDDMIYGDAKTSVSAAIALGNTQQALAGQGEWLNGGDGDDTLIGSATADFLAGGAGADLLVGGAGDDALLGDNDAMLSSRPTNSAWHVDTTDYTIKFNLNFNWYNDPPTPETSGNDVMYAGAGNDYAVGGYGNDVIFGEGGNDILRGGGDDDVVFGGDGNDVIFGDMADNVAFPARPGNDYLDGGAGDDTIRGNEGDDILLGGAGKDKLIGGEGADTYLYNRGDGADSITDTNLDNNILRFGVGIRKEDIHLRLNSSLLDLGNGDVIKIEGLTADDAVNSSSIRAFEFADGSSLSMAQLLAQKPSAPQANGDVAYTLTGGTGVDTFVLDSDSGHSVVEDDPTQRGIVQLGEGVSLNSLTGQRVGDSLLLSINGGASTMQLQEFFTSTQAWKIQDSTGKTVEPLALLETPEDRTAEQASQLWDAFSNQLKAQTMQHYRDQGWTSQADGTFTVGWAVYGARASSSVSTDTWRRYYTPISSSEYGYSTVTYSEPIYSLNLYSSPLWTAGTASIQMDVRQTDDALVYADAARQETWNNNALGWYVMNWTTPYSSSSGYTQILNTYPTTINGVTYYVDTVFRRDTTTYVQAQGTVVGFSATALGVQNLPNGLPEVIAASYSQRTVVNDIQQIQLGAGDQTVYANESTMVVGGTGNATIYDAGLVYLSEGSNFVYGAHTAYGGAGNDTLRASVYTTDTKLLGGAGDDVLIRGAVMDGGQGDDQLFSGSGEAVIKVGTTNSGTDLVGGYGDTERFLDTFYQSLGIENWQKSIDVPEMWGKYYPRSAEMGRGYYDEAGVIALFASWGAETLQDVLDNGWADVVEPLPVLVLTPGLDIEPSAVEYCRQAGIPVVELLANDAQALASYQAFLPEHKVQFGQGIARESLVLDWGLTNASISGEDAAQPYVTLNISWGASGMVQVLIPHFDDPIGSGVTAFEFSDGSTMSLAEMMALAPLEPDLDPQLQAFVFESGGGEQYSGDAYKSIQFAALVPSEVRISRTGADLVLSVTGSDDSVILSGWYVQPLAYSDSFSVDFADGGNWSKSYLTDQGLIFAFEPGVGEQYPAGDYRSVDFTALDSSQVRISRSGADLILSVIDSEDAVILSGWYAQQFAYPAFSVDFSGGTSWNKNYLTDQGLIADGSVGNQTLIGLEDYANTLIAGPGDTLIGSGSGQDTYVFNAGSGTVHIQDSSTTGTLQFGAGITPDQITLGVGSLMLRVGSGGDTIHIEGFDPQNALNPSAISTFRFADGTTLTLEQLLARGFDIQGTSDSETLQGTNLDDRIYSGGGNDTLIGGAGNDILIGGLGVNVYEFSRRGGHDVVDAMAKQGVSSGIDTVLTDAWLRDLQFNRLNGQVVISIVSAGATLTIKNIDAIGKIQSADGTYAIYEELSPLTARVTFHGVDGVASSFADVTFDDMGSAQMSFYDPGWDGAQSQVIDGQGRYVTTYFDEDAVKIGGSWFQLDGSRGWSSFYPDGQEYGENINPDGSYSAYGIYSSSSKKIWYYDADDNFLGHEEVFTGDENEYVSIRKYDLAGDFVSESYSYRSANGQHGSGTSFSDGSSTGEGFDPDYEDAGFPGAVAWRSTSDGLGNSIETQYTEAGVLLGWFVGKYTSSQTGSYWSSTQYEADGRKVFHIWQTNDGGGDETFQPDGTSTGNLQNYGDGSYSTFARDGAGTTNTLNFDAAGIVQGSVVTTDDGYGNTSSTEFDSTGVKLSYSWTTADGSTGSEVFHADGSVESTVTTVDSDGLTHIVHQVTQPDGSYQQDWSFSGTSNSGALNYDATTGETSGSSVVDGYSYSFVKKLNVDGVPGLTVLSETHLYADGSSYATATDMEPDGSYQKSWSKSDGSSGYDSYYPDGTSNGRYDSPSGISGYYDGAVMGIYGDDGHGTYNVMEYGADMQPLGAVSRFWDATERYQRITYLDTDWNEVSDTWNDYANGTWGADEFHADGSSSGTTNHEDGRYSSYVNDGLGNTTTQYFDAGSNLLNYVVVNDDGHGNVHTSTFDAAGNLVSDSWEHSNSAPEATLIAAEVAQQGVAYAFHIPEGSFVDPDTGDVLSYSAKLADGGALPAWLTFDAQTQTFRGTPQNADVGAVSVAVTATDLAGEFVTATFEINVANTNDAPVALLTLAPQAAVEQQPFTYTLPTGVFADIDAGDSLSYTLTQADGSALPAWLTFNDTDMTVSGTPTGEAVGGLELLLIATDTAGATATQALHIGVQALPVVSGTIGNNTLNAQATGSILMGLDGNDTLNGNVGGDKLYGGIGADRLYGQSGNDVLDGGDGNDRLEGGAGADQMLGGLGSDTYVVDDGGDSVTELADEGTDVVQSLVDYTLTANVENLTLTGTAAINGTGNELNNVITGNAAGNTLRGLAGNDTLRGGLEVDSLEGGEGNDRLDGGAGADQLAGGLGNDVYLVDEAGDVVTELADEGTDTVQSLVDYTLSDNVENLTLTGIAAISGTGNELNNVITGNAAGNLLRGLGGNDTLRGGLEADVLEGGEGNDRLDGGAGADQLAGGAGNDVYVVDEAGDAVTELADEGTDTVQSLVDYTLGANLENLTLTGTAATSGTGNELNNVITGNAAGNLLRGLGGNDTLRGGLEADVLEGGEGNDRLDGGAGADQLAGGLGNDVYVVDEAGDAVTELADEGTDTVQSLVDYTLGANLENLTLTGTVATSGTGNELNNVITGNVAGNTLHGLGGNDTLRGGLEADTLEGGVGNDRLEGGAGADTYLFARGEGQDVLVETDATVGVEDVLQFGHDITAEQIWLRQVGNSLEISLIGSSDKVAVANWYLGTDRHVEALQLSDGRQLLDSQVQSLVQAMAAFTPPPVGQTTLPESYAATLTPVIAANWQ